jgi:putative chitinase
MLSTSQLQQIAPNLKPELAAQYLPYLLAALKEFEISTPARIAAFLGQYLHETAEFRYFEEIADGAAYEGRADLGNIQPGDGRQFKGRGIPQLTGRTNYAKASLRFNVDFLAHPELVATLDYAYRVGGWYWATHRGWRFVGVGKERRRQFTGFFNELADRSLTDRNCFDDITRGINGGLNGRLDRIKYWRRALRVLGVIGKEAE